MAGVDSAERDLLPLEPAAELGSGDENFRRKRAGLHFQRDSRRPFLRGLSRWSCRVSPKLQNPLQDFFPREQEVLPKSLPHHGHQLRLVQRNRSRKGSSKCN